MRVKREQRLTRNLLCGDSPASALEHQAYLQGANVHHSVKDRTSTEQLSQVEGAVVLEVVDTEMRFYEDTAHSAREFPRLFQAWDINMTHKVRRNEE